MNKSKTLLDDGHARLSVDYSPEYLGEDVFSLTMSDGGGFTSIYITKEDWQNMKKIMDLFIKMKDEV